MLVCLFVYLSVVVRLSLSVCLFVCLSVCLHVGLSVHPVCRSVRSVGLSGLSVCPVCQSLRLWALSCVCVHRFAVEDTDDDMPALHQSVQLVLSLLKCLKCMRFCKCWSDLVPDNTFVV